MVQHLANEHEITLVGYRWPEQTPDALPGNVRVVSLPGPTRTRSRRAAGWIDGFRTQLPVQSVGMAAPLVQAIQKLLSEESFDVAHVTASAIAEVGPALEGIPKVLVSLDAWNLNAQSQTAASPPHLRLVRQLEERRIESFMRRTFPVYDSVVAVADEDARELQRLGTNHRVTVIPNGVDTTEFHPGTKPPEPGLLVFVGTMRWAPNITAARFLCQDVLPIVRRTHPDAHVAIVGRAASEELRNELESSPGVSVVGEVPDVGDWIRRAAVFCCPMLDGTGIKNKLLEGLSCGAPVVATPLSLQGTRVTSGEHLLIGEDAPELAEAIDALLDNSELAARLGSAGRAYVQRHHQWEAVAAAYAAEYRFVAGTPPVSSPTASARTEETLLIELTCFHAADASRQKRLEALGQLVDWSAFEQLASDLRILPLAVARTGGYPQLCLPDELRERAETMASRVRQYGTVCELCQLDFLAKCHDQDLAALALKGPELARRIYGDLGLRGSADVDVLVSLSDLPAAGLIAESMGYRSAPELLDRSGRPLLHRTYVHPDGELPPLEVHWRVHWYESQFAQDALLRSDKAGRGFHLLPEDELLALLLFFVRDGLQGLRYQADLVAWWRTYGDRVDLAELRRRFRSYPELTRAVGVAARVLAMQTHLDITSVLSTAAVDRYRAHLAVNTSSVTPARDVAEESARAAVVDALVSPPRQIPAVLLRRVLLPSATFELRMPSLRQTLPGVWHATKRVAEQLRILLRASSEPS